MVLPDWANNCTEDNNTMIPVINNDLNIWIPFGKKLIYPTSNTPKEI